MTVAAHTLRAGLTGARTPVSLPPVNESQTDSIGYGYSNNYVYSLLSRTTYYVVFQ